MNALTLLKRLNELGIPQRQASALLHFAKGSDSLINAANATGCSEASLGHAVTSLIRFGKAVKIGTGQQTRVSLTKDGFAEVEKILARPVPV